MRLNAANIKVFDMVVLAVLNLLFFEGPIQDATGFSYIDELAMVGLALPAVVSGKVKRLFGEDRAVVALFLAVCAIGLCGNLVFRVQGSVGGIFTDVVALLKFPFTLLACYALFTGRSTLRGVMLAEAKLLVAVLAVLALANLAFDFGMRSSGRYGIPAFQGFWGHPTYLVFACVGLVALLTVDFRANRFWIALALLVIASSLRSKGFVLIGIYIAMILFVGKGRVKVNAATVLAVLALAILIGWDAFSIYYVNAGDGWARNELQKTSLLVTRDYAPFGSGFATFATNSSGVYYSPLYYAYGLSQVYGLTPLNYSYMSDTFWPAILGQFGLGGFVLFILALTFVYRGIKRRAADKYVFIAALLPVLYLLVSSAAESAFFNPYSVYLAFCTALACISLAGEERLPGDSGHQVLMNGHR